jgi:hypothetical protein
MEGGTMKRHFRILLPVISVLALMAAGAAQAQQTLYKYLGADGKTVYSDKPPAAGVKFEKIQTNTAPTGVNLRPSPNAVQAADQAIATKNVKEAEKSEHVAELQRAYDDAVAALDAAKDPQEGERTQNANGTSRLNDNYFNRVADLQAKVDAAREALDAAKRE